MTEKEMIEAWDRVARSADGHAIYLYLQQRLMSVSPDVESGTLRSREGERIFASKLIGLMAKGIEESASGLSARIVTISRTGPVAVASTRGAGRRVNADTVIAGWNDGPSADPKSGTGT